MKIVVQNKKAYFDYFVLETYEAGIALVGCEVKSIRSGHASLNDAYISISSQGEAFVKNMYIKTYEKSSAFTADEKRVRKLLLSKKELQKLSKSVKEKGLTIVPLKLYFKGPLVKLEIGLVKGKHNYDKREVLKQKDKTREVERQLKNY
mgnify:CR=1 FL=1